MLPQATIVIKTAAVSDYRPKAASGQKIKRKGPMTLELEATPDILEGAVVRRRRSQIVVGFAAETENVLENARKKLVAKNLDAIVVNDVSREGVGFDSDRNAVTIITRDEVVEVPETTKWEVAQRVLDQIVRLRQQQVAVKPDHSSSVIPIAKRRGLAISHRHGVRPCITISTADAPSARP